MNYCKLAPTIILSDGKEAPSELYNSIMERTKLPKAQARDIAIGIVEAVEKGYIPEAPAELLDSQGRPTLEHILNVTNFNKILGITLEDLEKEREQLVDKKGEVKTTPSSPISYVEMLEKAIKYNASSKDFIMLLKHNEETDTLEHVIVRRNRASAKEADLMKEQYALHNKLTQILKDNGIAVGSLMEHEKQLRIAGVTAFQTAKKVANNIIELIRLNDGKEGFLAFPEEFSHWMLDVTREDPRTKRLIEAVKDQEVVRTILGEHYDMYLEKYNGDLRYMSLEAAAHLMADALTQSKENKNILTLIVTKVKELFLKFFKPGTDALINLAIKEAQGYAEVLANQTLNDKFSDFRLNLGLSLEKDMYQMAKGDLNISSSSPTITELIQKGQRQNPTNPKGTFQENTKKKAKEALDKGFLLDEKIFERHIGEKGYLNSEEQRLLNTPTADFEELSEITKKIIELEQTRYAMYKTQGVTQIAFERNQFNLIRDLQATDELTGFEHYYTAVHTRLAYMLKQLNVLGDRENPDPQVMAQLLVNIRHYIRSYTVILAPIQERLHELKQQYTEAKKTATTADERAQATKMLSKIETLQDSFTEAAGKHVKVQALYNAYAIPFWVETLKPILGDEVEVPAGLFKTKLMKLEDYIKEVPKDISWTDMMLDTLSQSSAPILRAMDVILNKAKTTAYSQTLDFIRDKIFVLGKKLDALGPDKSWAFERDEKGNLTDYYLSDVRHHAFEEARKQERNRIKELYPDAKYKDYRKELMRDWVEKNTDDTGKPRKRDAEGKVLWENVAYTSLSSTKKEILEEFMLLKGELDKMLPPPKHAKNVIFIRKDMAERVRNSSNVEDLYSSVKTSIQDAFIRRSDDDAFGAAITTDFDNRPMHTLPLMYRARKKDENPNELSTDLVTTLSAYAMMAFNYQEIQKVATSLDLGLYTMLDNSTVGITVGKNTLYNPATKTQAVKQFSESRLFKRMDQALAHSISSIREKEEGAIPIGDTHIDIRKAANVLNTITARVGLSFNFLTATASALNGLIMQQVEAMGGQFYTHKDLLAAEAVYMRDIAPYVAERGQKIKNSKMELFLEKTNILYDIRKRSTNLNWDRARINRTGMDSILMFLDKSGNHWLTVRNALAIANHDYVLSGHTKMSIYEAYDVVTDSEGISHLQLKKGLKTQDGLTIITKEELKKRAEEQGLSNVLKNLDPHGSNLIKEGEISEETYMMKYSAKAREVNTYLLGNYDEDTMSYAKTYTVGSLILMYRRFIKPALNHRFQKRFYNERLGSYVEGYYRSSLKVLFRILKEITTAGTKLNVTKEEKQNLKRASVDAMVIAICMVMKNLFDDDDEEEGNNPSWIKSMIEYLSRRMLREIGALSPSPLMVTEGIEMVKMPATSIITLEMFIKTVFGFFNKDNYEEFAGEEALIQGGTWEGVSKVNKNLRQWTPEKNIRRALHPEDAIYYYQQTDNWN